MLLWLPVVLCVPIYVLVNCLLNSLAICVGEEIVFSLKVIVYFLLANPCMVF